MPRWKPILEWQDECVANRQNPDGYNQDHTRDQKLTSSAHESGKQQDNSGKPNQDKQIRRHRNKPRIFEKMKNMTDERWLLMAFKQYDRVTVTQS